jgi:uncharacterized protein YjiS (DUF1127 family)
MVFPQALIAMAEYRVAPDVEIPRQLFDGAALVEAFADDKISSLAVVRWRSRRRRCRGGRFLSFRDLVDLAMFPDDIQEGVSVFFKLSRADPVDRR